jgi:hypothetical protein
MAWAEVVKWSSIDAALAVSRRIRESLEPRAISVMVPATVPVCRCSGECRCGSLVPYLLQHQIEMECEFYRDVH